MKIFFAGGETRQYYKILQEAKVENKLESFFSLGMGKNPPGNQGFKHYLLDSGGVLCKDSRHEDRCSRLRSLPE